MLPIGCFLLSHLSPGVNMYQWRRRRPPIPQPGV